MGDNYDVFLSHAECDVLDVEEIAKRLHTEGIRPFFGRWTLIAGESRVRGIEQGLVRSATVAVFIGNSGRDAWRDQQADFALIEGTNRRVIPVLLPGTTPKALEGLLKARVWVQLDDHDGFERLLGGIRGHAPDLAVNFEPTPIVRGGIEDARSTELRRPQTPARPLPYTVFVSCDLGLDEALREQLREVIQQAGMVPHGLDGAGDNEPLHELEARQQQLNECDLFLMVVGWRYGEPSEEDGRSRTEVEYESACRAQTPRLVMLRDEAEPVVVGDAFDDAEQRWSKQIRLDALKQRLRSSERLESFCRANLGARLTHALHRWRRQGAGTASRPPPPETAPSTVATAASVSPAPTPPLSPVAQHLASIEQQCGTTTMFGPSGVRSTTLNPDDIRVRVRPIASAAELDGRVPEAELQLREVFGQRHQPEHRVVALVGPRGSGKSDHLRRFALWLSRRGAASLGLVSDTIPVRIDLAQSLPCSAVPEPLRAHERLLLLVDGFDALVDAGDRARAAAWLDDTMASLPAATALVARQQAHDATPEANDWQTPTLSVQLAPLSDDDARALVERWFAARPDDDTKAGKRTTAAANALWQQLSSPRYRSARLFELARNPVMLTVVCAVFDDRETLATRRVELFEQCVEVLVGQWLRRAELPPRFGDREARELLGVIAHYLHQRGTTQASFDDLAEAIAKPLQAIFGTDPVDPIAFLRAVSLDHCIFVRRGERAAGLLHPSLQEYLCARHLRARSHGTPTVLDDLVARISEPWWREVGLLLLELGEPALFRPLLDRLIESGTLARNSDWVLDSLTDSAEATIEPLVQLVQDSPSNDKERWREQLAAATIVEKVEPASLARAREQLRQHPDPHLRQLADPGPQGPRTRLSPRGAYAMVRVPETTFEMGSHHRERHHRPSEGPRHSVTLAEFSIGRAPVTNEEYGRYLRACPDAREPIYWGDSRYNQPQQPVVGVSWDEALAYCTWAGLSLPTEAQWECACRAGRRTAYWSGRDEADLARVGWYAANSDERLRPVAGLPANPLGLYDVHGNIGEWCLDDFGSYRSSLPRAGDGLRHPPTPGHNRVIRGGSWIEEGIYARSAYRLNRHPDNRVAYVGFRAVESSD